MDRKQDNSNICNKNESRMKEKTSSEGSDKRRVNLGVWAPKFGRSFAIWQFGRTFGFPKSENYAYGMPYTAVWMPHNGIRHGNRVVP